MHVRFQQLFKDGWEIKISEVMIKKYLLYLLRWQLSTPILAVCCIGFNRYGTVTATILANLIGGLIFFWVDKLIFKERK